MERPSPKHMMSSGRGENALPTGGLVPQFQGSPRLIVVICPLNPWIFKEEKRMEPEISPDFKAGFSPQWEFNKSS